MNTKIQPLIRIFFKTRIIRHCFLVVSLALCLVVLGLAAGLKSSDWASWVQAFGAIIAIGVAFFLGAKQSRTTLDAVIFTIDYATRRKYEAYSAIAKAVAEHCDSCLHVFKPHGMYLFDFVISDLDKNRHSLINALEAIPIHEVGTIGAVQALVDLRKSMGYLSTAVERATAHVDSFGASPPFFFDHDNTVIHMNCNAAKAQCSNLMDALTSPIAVTPNE